MAVGRPTLYDPEFHPKEVMRLTKELGYFDVQFARDWDINIDTIYEWRKVHPEFSDACHKGKSFRRAYWVDRMQEGVHLPNGERMNERLLTILLKYDGHNPDERIVKLPELVSCKTFKQQGTVIMGALAVGKITLKEANGYVDIIGKLAKIDEVTELRRMLEEIEQQKKQGR